MDAEVRVLMDSIERARERLSPPKSAPPVKPAPPPESSSTAMGATNDESISSTAREAASAASLEKKNAGNDAMKDNDYLRAIELYTEAIDLDPSNMMFFNNRAQAYLKVSRFGEAEADSSLVIDANKRLPNLKALFRRALARKGINTVKSLTAALEDLSAILKAEPANKEAGKEKLRVNALLAKASSEESAALERAASTAASSPAGGSGGDGLVARSTRIKTPTKPRT
ncbi:TOC64, partial [Symbiodinium microadriaticum]